MSRAAAFVTICAAVSTPSALACLTRDASVLNVCGQAALVSDSDGGAALSLIQRKVTSRVAVLERAEATVQMAQREAAEGGDPEVSVEEARALAMQALGGAGLSILGHDSGDASVDDGEASKEDDASSEVEGRHSEDVAFQASVDQASGHESHARAGPTKHTKKSTGLDKGASKHKSSKDRDTTHDSAANDRRTVVEKVARVNGKGHADHSVKGDALRQVERNGSTDVKEGGSQAASRKLLDREEDGHAVANKTVKESKDDTRNEDGAHNVSLAAQDQRLTDADAKHRASRRKAEAEVFMLPDNVSFTATSHGRVYPMSEERALAAASSEMWGSWHMGQNRTEPPPAVPQAAMLGSQPVEVSGRAEEALESAVADFKAARGLTGAEAARAAHQLLGTAAAAAAAASGRLQRFTRHEGSHCTGSDIDLLSSWSGTHNECADKCVELGPACTGFVRAADTGAADPSLGRCFFRSGEVLKQKHQTSECYVRRYHVQRGESCGWGPTIAAMCGWSNQLNISTDGGRSTAAPTDEEEICGALCDKHEECGGFNYHQGTCFYRRSTTCGDVLHREKGAACYTKVPTSE